MENRLPTSIDRNHPHKSKENKGEKNEEEARNTIEWELINE
jgi:hypothetical protein